MKLVKATTTTVTQEQLLAALREFIEASEYVIGNWESGDLAEAVNYLQAVMEEHKPKLKEAK